MQTTETRPKLCCGTRNINLNYLNYYLDVVGLPCQRVAIPNSSDKRIQKYLQSEHLQVCQKDNYTVFARFLKNVLQQILFIVACFVCSEIERLLVVKVLFKNIVKICY
jgi:hypothetical protein